MMRGALDTNHLFYGAIQETIGSLTERSFSFTDEAPDQRYIDVISKLTAILANQNKEPCTPRFLEEQRVDLICSLSQFFLDETFTEPLKVLDALPFHGYRGILRTSHLISELFDLFQLHKVSASQFYRPVRQLLDAGDDDLLFEAIRRQVNHPHLEVLRLVPLMETAYCRGDFSTTRRLGYRVIDLSKPGSSLPGSVLKLHLRAASLFQSVGETDLSLQFFEILSHKTGVFSFSLEGYNVWYETALKLLPTQRQMGLKFLLKAKQAIENTTDPLMRAQLLEKLGNMFENLSEPNSASECYVNARNSLLNGFPALWHKGTIWDSVLKRLEKLTVN